MSLADLRASLGTIVHKIQGGTLEEKYSGHIPDTHIYQTDPTSGRLVQAPPSGRFLPDQSYLQVVINQMYLSQSRKLWIEREHLGAVWMSFRYAGAIQTIPFTVGRDLLVDKVKSLPPTARIEFRDVRVGKIYPYTGDSLSLYLGLWSTETVNWANKVFSALDIIANIVKVSGSLSLVLDMVGVLNQGISTLLGLDDIQAHLNLYQEFQDTASPVAPLQPGYYVMIDVPNATFDPSTLCVVDGKLGILGEDKKQILPFYVHDFLLYTLSSLPYLSYAPDLFNTQYRVVVSELIGSQLDQTRQQRTLQEFATLLNQINNSLDLTQSDKNRLISFYNQRFTQDQIAYAMSPLRSSERHLGGKKPALPKGLEQPTSEEFEVHATQIDAELLTADPTTFAGAALAKFAATLQEVGSSH